MRLAVVGTMLCVTWPAAAQDCKTMADPAARLSCYDKASSPTQKTSTKRPADPYAEIKSDIARTLKDPPSAIFSELNRAIRPNMRGEPTDTVCGLVNAKNSYGGYTGAQKFVYFPATKRVHIAGGAGSMPEMDGIVANNFCK